MHSMTRDHPAEPSGHSSPGVTRLRVTSEPSYLTRLGIVWAYPLRLTIITELYVREMSATEFCRRFGGGSVGNVSWHFQVLAKHGWIRKVRTKKVPRGRPQDVYRATELAFYDDECAAELPLSLRAAFTARILQQMGERIAEGLAAGTIDSKRDRFLHLDSLRIDEVGWGETMEVLGGCFRGLNQEQTDAKIRLSDSGSSPSSVLMVCIGGFESPPLVPRSTWRTLRRYEAPPFEMDTQVPLETRMAKVFTDPISLLILRQLNDAAMSASQLNSMIEGATQRQLFRKCSQLEKLGWIARVDERTGGLRRGATEVFYRATRPPIATDLWSEVPKPLRSGPSWQMLHSFYGRAVEAIKAGTMDARPEKHLTWSALIVDEIGWQQVIRALRECKISLEEIQRRADLRGAGSDNENLITTVFLGGFEIPELGGKSS